jgi:hypothetical protein
MSVRIKLNGSLKAQVSHKIVIDAEYSDSVLMGFVYKSGRRHQEWDYIAEATTNYDSNGKFLDFIAQGQSIQKAAGTVAEGLADELRETLREAPVDTLGWWVEDFNPSDHVSVEK